MKSIGVICFLWWNPKFRAQYTPKQVNTLFSMVKRHLHIPFTFYCATNAPSEEFRSGIEILSIAGCPTLHMQQIGSWPCLNLFNPAIQARIAHPVILKLDLDSVITGPIGALLDSYDENRITGWLDITHKILNPSFALIKNGFGHNIWHEFLSQPDRVRHMIETGHADKYGWDQAWLNQVCTEGQKRFLTKDNGVYHRREIARSGRLPGDARIVYFNSTHKPWHENMKLHYPWIKEHYR